MLMPSRISETHFNAFTSIVKSSLQLVFEKKTQHHLASMQWIIILSLSGPSALPTDFAPRSLNQSTLKPLRNLTGGPTDINLSIRFSRSTSGLMPWLQHEYTSRSLVCSENLCQVRQMICSFILRNWCLPCIRIRPGEGQELVTTLWWRNW